MAKFTPCIMSVQYIGGCSAHQGVFSTLGNTLSISGGYHGYIGHIMIHVGGYHEYIGGYYEYIRGCSGHRRDIMGRSRERIT